MSPEIGLMSYLQGVTGIPLRPFVERDSASGFIIENNKPYAIMGDIRVNHQKSLNGDYVDGGLVISGFFPKAQGRLAEEWAEYMRRKLLRSELQVGDYTYFINTVRKQVRKDITTHSILHRVTLTISFERSNEIYK